jgi:hypothetical protein
MQQIKSLECVHSSTTKRLKERWEKDVSSYQTSSSSYRVYREYQYYRTSIHAPRIDRDVNVWREKRKKRKLREYEYRKEMCFFMNIKWFIIKYSQSLLIPTAKHFLNLQYWHRFLFSLITKHLPSRKQRYSICFWMLRRKNPWKFIIIHMWWIHCAQIFAPYLTTLARRHTVMISC